MDALDRAIAAAVERQKKGVSALATREEAAAPNLKVALDTKSNAVDPWSPEAILRAANEDDDLYDPYSDYMDALARSSYEEPEADPWR